MAEDLLNTGLLNPNSAPVDRILDAAELCFHDLGYQATSLRKIAEAAEISKSLIHYHFRSKEHLFLEVQVRIYNRLAAQMRRASEQGGSVSERALSALDALFEVLKANPDIQVQTKVWRRSLSDEGLRKHALHLRERLRGELIQTMELILEPVRPVMTVDLEVVADLLWATISGLGLQTFADNDPQRVERAFQALRRLAATALKLAEMQLDRPTAGTPS